MKIRLLGALIITVVSLLGIHNAHAQQTRVFTSSAGKEIKGKILSATESDVTILLENGREITGGLTYFSKGDQTHIAEWRKKNPAQYKYDFDIDVSRERVDRNKRTESNTVVVYENWSYKLKIENRSKIGNNGATVKDLELQYNIIKTADANARMARELHQGMTARGGKFTKAGKLSLGSIDYLKEADVKTPTVPVNHSELAPGWYYADGTKDEKEDELKGIWIKLLKDGKVVYEEKNGSKDVENTKWVAPSGGASKSRSDD